MAQTRKTTTKTPATPTPPSTEAPAVPRPQLLQAPPSSPDADRERRLEQAIAQIRKDNGQMAVSRISENMVMEVEAISTGILSFDWATRIWGFPRGRVTELYGPEQSGKTTFALHACATVLRAGGTAVMIDAEHAFDRGYFANLARRAAGIDINTASFILSQPDYGEQALEILETFVQMRAADIVVIDSTAALTPKAEIEGSIGDSFPGAQARMMSQALRKLTPVIAKSGTAVVFINQLREKIGVMGHQNPEQTPGGRALKFYSSIRVDVRRIGQLKESADENSGLIGQRVRAKIVKNKCAPPMREAESVIVWGLGVDVVWDTLDLAVNLKIVDKNGAWFSWDGEKLGQGALNSVQNLVANWPLFMRLYTAVWNHIYGVEMARRQKVEDDNGAAKWLASGKTYDYSDVPETPTVTE